MRDLTVIHPLAFAPSQDSEQLRGYARLRLNYKQAHPHALALAHRLSRRSNVARSSVGLPRCHHMTAVQCLLDDKLQAPAASACLGTFLRLGTYIPE